ncbi:MAG: WD40 repeat domain-containing protein [Candidatus Lokiarchaeota archaeon]|nr:WD40 repeat domain-containing protein [Candidatus Lokiarchaeota archaeon]
MRIQKIWDYKCNDQLLGLKLGDLTNNNKQEIIVFSKSGKMYIFSLDGRLLFEDEITENTPIWNLIIDDMNENDRKKLIMGGLDGLLRIFNINPSLTLFPLWAHQFGASISGVLLDDINGDGLKEIIAYSLDKSLRILSILDGSLIWGQLFEEGVSDAIFIKDDDNQDDNVIVAVGNDGTIRSFNYSDGNLLSFMKFTNKMRALTSFNLSDKQVIVCGGDDKNIHILDRNLKREIDTLKFNDVVWKLKPFKYLNDNSLLISTYSFDFLDDSIPINQQQFSSKLTCLDTNLNVKWELSNTNIEVMTPFLSDSMNLIITGTTKGEILILDCCEGKILTKLSTFSCVNDIKIDFLSNIFVSCHDDGSINAYFIDDS